MVVGAGLIVRNLYVPFIRPNASERECLWAGRLTGMIVVAGSVIFSLTIYDMLGQLKLTFWFPLVFAAPFWIGMYWRKATGKAAWITVVYCLIFFFVIPFFGPRVFNNWRSSQVLMTQTVHTRTISREVVSKSILRRNLAEATAEWNSTAAGLTGSELDDHNQWKPRRISAATILLETPDGMQEIEAGVTRLPKTSESKSSSIFWDKVVARDELAVPKVVASEQVDEFTVRETLEYPAGTEFLGEGSLKLNLLFYKPLGIDLAKQSTSSLNALELIPKIVMPFLVMIIASLFTTRNSDEALDRYYAKMKTPVDPDPEADTRKLEAAYADPSTCERVKLLPGSSLEFQKPTTEDIVGFVISVAVCFGIIGVAFWMASLGS